MLAANQAVRLGLRAATRNPELAFGYALIDQVGALLALLPVVLAGALLAGVPLGARLLRALGAISISTLGAIAAALLVSFVAGAVFWAGALPILAADAEMDRRPPAGNFALLASRGAARTLAVSALGTALTLLLSLSAGVAVVAALPSLWLSSSKAAPLLFAAALPTFLFATLLVDLLTRLWLVRAAAFGDAPARAFSRAAEVLGARLGACLLITVAFYVLEIVAGSALAVATGMVSTTSLDPAHQLLALAPRAAIGIAAAVVLAWLETGKQAALAALVAGEEGLIEPPPPPPRRGPVPVSLLRPPRVVEAEPVIEAEPVAEAEPVIEALPVPDDDEER